MPYKSTAFIQVKTTKKLKGAIRVFLRTTRVKAHLVFIAFKSARLGLELGRLPHNGFLDTTDQREPLVETHTAEFLHIFPPRNDSATHA